MRILSNPRFLAVYSGVLTTCTRRQFSVADGDFLRVGVICN